MNVEPRPLTDEERSILDLLLTPTFDGVEQLRQQVAAARVVGHCDCGCPTIYIATDPAAPSAPVVGRLAPVEARTTPAGNEPPGDIILFVDDGRVTSLEYVFYGNDPPSHWPSLDRLTLFKPGR